MFTKHTQSELVKLTGYSKSYISMVLSEKRKAPPRLKALLTKKLTSDDNIIQEFLTSRETSGCAPTTLRYYRQQLSYYRSKKGKIRASQQDIEKYLNSIPPNDDGLGNRHAAYRALRAFYNWSEMTHDLPNPMKKVKAPIQSKPILPALSREQVKTLIDSCPQRRDKAIIALLTESGLRLTELTNIKPEDIDWKWNVIKVMGKGRKEAYAPFGMLTLQYLQEWLNLSQPEKGSNIWGVNKWGISTMLRRLERATGLPCNPHTFRRTFACLLRKDGVDSMTIKDLGRWESLEMLERYTRTVTFMDAMKHYKAPLG